MDAATADALLAAAQHARAATRSHDDDALEGLSAKYPQMRAAVEWYLEQGLVLVPRRRVRPGERRRGVRP